MSRLDPTPPPVAHVAISSRRRPPRAASTLDHLLQRLRREVDAFPMDPRLPARVEEEIRRQMASSSYGPTAARPPAPAPAHARSAPPARHPRRWRAAAVFLLALGACVALPGGRPLGPPSAFAGPLEARALWDRARALRDAPWRERVVAYRAAIEQTHPTDRLRIRALLALAGVLREADHPHGAASAEWLASSLGPRAEETRIAAHLAHAKAMRSEGDPEAATDLLREVADAARSESPRLADQALDLLAEEVFQDGDLGAVEAALARALRERASATVVVRIAGRAGELRLAAADVAAARRHLATAERAFRRVAGREDDEALRATKAWLDLPLRRRLPEAGGR